MGIAAEFKTFEDGLSKTILMGEVLPECSEHVTVGWAWTNNTNGLMSTVIPINFDTCNQVGPSASGIDNCNKWCNWTTALGFKSRHPGGAQFVFGDGAVRLLSENIDHAGTYQYLGDRADGNAIIESAF